MRKKVINQICLFICVIIFSCKTPLPLRQVVIEVNTDSKHPIELSTSTIYPVHQESLFIDTFLLQKMFTVKSGERIFLNRTNHVSIFETDTITIKALENGEVTWQLQNFKNSLYNNFIKSIDSVRYKYLSNLSLYLFDYQDSVISNEAFVLSYIEQTGKKYFNQLESLARYYQLTKQEASEVLKVLTPSRNITLSFSYFKGVQAFLDSLQLTQKHLEFYISKLNELPLNKFTSVELTNMLNEIAYVITQNSIRRLKTKTTIINYYNTIHPFLEKDSWPEQYVASQLWLQAKKMHIPIKGNELREIQKKAKKFQYHYYAKFISKQPSVDVENDKEDKELYNYEYESVNLNDILKNYIGKPLLINFWASWCLPCIKKMPELNQYQKQFSSLNIIHVSLDQSFYSWKSFLFDNKINTDLHFRRNLANQPTIFKNMQTIPKYGLLQKDGSIIILEELDESVIQKYLTELDKWQ